MNIQDFIKNLEKSFKNQDEAFIKNDIEKSLELREFLKNFQYSEDAKNLCEEMGVIFDPKKNFNNFEYQRRLRILRDRYASHHVYEILALNKDGDVIARIEKENNAKFEKRNHKIASKLLKENVQEINEVSTNFSNDGFNGVYEIKTDK